MGRLAWGAGLAQVFMRATDMSSRAIFQSLFSCGVDIGRKSGFSRCDTCRSRLFLWRVSSGRILASRRGRGNMSREYKSHVVCQRPVVCGGTLFKLGAQSGRDAESESRSVHQGSNVSGPLTVATRIFYGRRRIL